MTTQRCPTCGRPQGKTRSSRENAYYWPVVVGILSDELGYSPKDMHEVLKQEHGLRETKEILGKLYIISKSTTEYTTVEFEDYLTRCRVWASENGYFIPLPNESNLHDPYTATP